MSNEATYTIPLYKELRLFGIGRCFYRLSDGGFFLNGKKQTSFSHPEEPYIVSDRWQMVLLLYPGEATISGVNNSFEPGTVMVLPPSTPLVLRFQADSLHITCHFFLEGIEPDKSLGSVSALTALESSTELQQFRETLDFAYETQFSHMYRASEFVDGLFKRLTQHSSANSTPKHIHPSVRKAMEWFEIHLSKSIRVTDLAEICGITRRHLLNLFKQELGISVSRYMRKRRARRAHLLLTETDRPIKLIASDIGIRDIAHFSKIMREEYGTSPRKLRHGIL